MRLWGTRGVEGPRPEALVSGSQAAEGSRRMGVSEAQCQGKVPAVVRGGGWCPRHTHISKCSAAPFRLDSDNYGT